MLLQKKQLLRKLTTSNKNVQSELVEIGYVIRTHGVKGHIRIAFDENCKELSTSEALYFFVKGVYMPHFIKEMETFQNGDVLVLLEEVANREDAELFARKPVFGPADWLDEDEPDAIEQFVGFTIQDEQQGIIGPVIAATDMGEYILITVEYNSTEKLIPLHPDLILDVDPDKEIIKTRLPEGLLQL